MSSAWGQDEDNEAPREEGESAGRDRDARRAALRERSSDLRGSKRPSQRLAAKVEHDAQVRASSRAELQPPTAEGGNYFASASRHRPVAAATSSGATKSRRGESSAAAASASLTRRQDVMRSITQDEAAKAKAKSSSTSGAAAAAAAATEISHGGSSECPDVRARTLAVPFRASAPASTTTGVSTVVTAPSPSSSLISTRPGAYAVPGLDGGSGHIPADLLNHSDRRDSLKSEESLGLSAGPSTRTHHSVTATLVTDDSQRQSRSPQEAVVVDAVAKKDSFAELLRHDRRTRIITGVVLLSMIGLAVTLGVVLSRPAPVPPSTGTNDKYMPVGSNIDGPGRTFEHGPGEYAKFGSSVSMSWDGSMVAIGAPEYAASSDAGRNRGLVQVFEEKDGDWTLLEPSILGDAVGDMAGSSVALSLDGRTVAVGSPGHDGGSIDGSARVLPTMGQVKIYRRTATSWEELGQTIVGDAANDGLGSSIGISSNGSRVAVSITGGDVRGSVERARVFEYKDDENAWVQLGDDLKGRYGGSPLSMSADGNTVAMGSVSMAENGNTAAVRVYEYARGGWRLMGSDIILKGAEGSYDTGWTPSISSDGKTVAIGSTVMNPDLSLTDEEYDLNVRVFRFSEDDGDWYQLGDTLHDKKGSHLISYVVSLSADSTVLAIGDPGGFAMGVNSGHSHVLRLVDGNWVHVDRELEGNDSADLFGHAVSVSADGSRVGIGAPKSRATGAELGRVSVFALQELS